MAFLSEDEMRAMRLAGARPFPVAGMSKKLLIVKLSSAAAIESGELEKMVKAGSKTQGDIQAFMLANACANDKGDLIGDAAARELLGVLPLSSLLEVIKGVSADLDAATKAADPGNRSGSASASPTV